MWRGEAKETSVGVKAAQSRSPESGNSSPCSLLVVEAGRGQEGRGQAACWEAVPSWAGTTVTWAPFPVLPRPPRAASGVLL